mmetsp:Transcript_131784/g.196371  ORF Transcript_131784/g.196371 Transcript_131784/m.196371 type:complete len:83 (-) Transcript_131784:200-448(-)
MLTGEDGSAVVLWLETERRVWLAQKTMLQKLMGMASAPNNIVAALGQPVHMDGSGNNDSFFRARQSNAGFRASVFANPMMGM